MAVSGSGGAERIGSKVSERTGPGGYRELLERLDHWFEEARGRAQGLLPCRAGCSACCHGPFDVSVADVELLLEAVRRLPRSEQVEVRRRARALLETMGALEPRWCAPHSVLDLGDERFDHLCETLADQPCPLLDDAGCCRIYPDRPMICRFIGLSMVTSAGRLIENACPIQDQFPGYADLPAFPFDLEELEVAELECLQGAARRVLGDSRRHDFETTIAAAIIDFTPPEAQKTARLEETA
jgi:Fe-S-cluster containining protein